MPPISITDWQEAAALDDALCRAFARRFGARLPHTRHAAGAWPGCARARRTTACCCPTPLAGTWHKGADDWYLYYVWGESLFRRSRAERERMEMLILAESADDWAELMRQALRGRTVRRQLSGDAELY